MNSERFGSLVELAVVITSKESEFEQQHIAVTCIYSISQQAGFSSRSDMLEKLHVAPIDTLGAKMRMNLRHVILVAKNMRGRGAVDVVSR